MKLVIAIIQPHKLEEVKNELTKNEIYRLTVSDVQGYGQQKEKQKYSVAMSTKSTFLGKCA